MSCSYSRRRPRSKGDIVQPTHRTQQDAVTGELVVTLLDEVQLAFEAMRRTLDGLVLKYNLPPQSQERLADLVMIQALRMKRHRDSDVEALRELLRDMNQRG